MKVRGVLGMASIAVSTSICGGFAWSALGAHEHGVADLTVAVEGHTVDLMLTAPTADLVGFERAPASEQERASIRERVSALEAGSWFVWDGGRCEQVSVEVTLPAGLTGSAATADDGVGGQQDHGHRQHAHDRQRKQDGHKSHDHKSHEHKGHDHEAHDHADHDHEHMDGAVSWQYRCEPGARLRSVNVQLFESLPLTRIRAQTISDRGQGAGNLSPASRRLNLP